MKGKRPALTNLEKPTASRRSNNEGTYIDRGNGSWAYRRQFRGKLIEKQARADTESKAKRLAKAKVDEAIKLLKPASIFSPKINSATTRNLARARNAAALRHNRQAVRRVAETTFANYAETYDASRSTSATCVWTTGSAQVASLAVAWRPRARRPRTSAPQWCG